MTPEATPRAVVFGLSGPRLTDDERALFRECEPLGFILFQRNCVEPHDIKHLCADLRDLVGRPDAPILIDQEGGRVQRLKPPFWRLFPPARRFGTLYQRSPERGLEATYLNGRLIAHDLHQLGITVDCAPVLDLSVVGGHNVIGDRAFDPDPDIVFALGAQIIAALRAGGVVPIIKHIPGHGRAQIDSHIGCPVVDASLAELSSSDFVPFRSVVTAGLGDLVWGMTAHILFPQLDAVLPATVSPTIIGDVIRREIGFDGLLISDDLVMEALDGGPGQRAAAAAAAGCDVLLHCSGEFNAMAEIAQVVPTLSPEAAGRLARAGTGPIEEFDRAAAEARLDELLTQS